MSEPSIRWHGSLAGLGLGARLGLSALLLVIAAGLCASLAHLHWHHENRDQEPGVSLTDLEGAYHGLHSIAPLSAAILRGHPEQLPPKEREVLQSWLGGKRVSEDYDSLELGDDAPAEILARRCVECHSRAGLDGAHAKASISLERWEDVAKVAFSRNIEAVPAKLLAASTHAHALALAPLSIVVLGLVFAGRFGARWGSGLSAFNGLALAVDLGGWWLAREVGGLAALIATAGALYALSLAIALLLVFADLWLPRP